MSFAAQTLRAAVRKLLFIQLIVVVCAALVYFSLRGGNAALAATFGGSIALLNTLVSAHRLRRATEAASGDPQRGMMEFYIGAAIRFLATPALIGFGIAGFGLNPVAIIVGFGTAQIAYLFNNFATKPVRQPAER